MMEFSLVNVKEGAQIIASFFYIKNMGWHCLYFHPEEVTYKLFAPFVRKGNIKEIVNYKRSILYYAEWAC